MNLVLIMFAVLFAVAPVKADKSAAPAAARPAAVKEAPVLIDSRFSRQRSAPWEKSKEAEPVSTVQTC